MSPVVKNPPANAGNMGSIPGLGRSPGEGHSNPLQYSCLGNPKDRRAWPAIVHGRHDLAAEHLGTAVLILVPSKITCTVYDP